MTHGRRPIAPARWPPRPRHARKAAAGVACRLAREAGLGASGSVTTTGQEIAVANSRELIASTERGLLVTHFHYTRAVHPLHVIITGMTRDGTYLIERGEVTRPVKNLRYTQSYLDALRDVRGIGRNTLLRGELIVSRVPALKIGSFTFTGVTE